MLNKLKRAALGAHTPHDKATAASKPIPMPLPAQVRILMSQHIGAPAKALVKKGDEVFVGTKIGEAGGFVSANIHSSVSGTVAAVEPFRLSNGRMCDSVVIKTDGKQTVDPAVKAPEVTDKASFLKAVRECGLVGLGGAGFPTDVKLQPKQQVDTLLINASECEVWLTSDTQEMLNCSDDIIRGIKAVLQYTGIPKCVIGIENNKPECIDLLCQKTKDTPEIESKPLLNSSLTFNPGVPLVPLIFMANSLWLEILLLRHVVHRMQRSLRRFPDGLRHSPFVGGQPPIHMPFDSQIHFQNLIPDALQGAGIVKGIQHGNHRVTHWNLSVDTRLSAHPYGASTPSRRWTRAHIRRGADRPQRHAAP